MHADETLTKTDPFFIIYKARSGSTYFSNLLANHPHIGVAPESSLISILWNWSRNRTEHRIATREQLIELLDLLYAEPKFAVWHLPRASLFEQLLEELPLSISELARKIILIQCRRSNPNSLSWGHKSGQWGIRNISLLHALFPRAKFIHIVRDGRAVFASSKKALLGVTRLPFETDPVQSAFKWKMFMTEVNKWKGTGFVLEIQYEHLLKEPPAMLKKVLTFLEVDAGDHVIQEMLEPRRTFQVHERYSHLHPNVGKPPQYSRINAWREELSPDEVRTFERIAGRMLVKKGYPLMYPRRQWDNLYSMMREGIWIGTRCMNRIRTIKSILQTR